MAKRRAEGEALLQERFARAVSEGDLPPDTDPADLARFVAPFRTACQSKHPAVPLAMNSDELPTWRYWPGRRESSTERT